MKGYGLPRNWEIDAPDCGDIKTYGLKSSTGKFRGKGGDYRSSHKNPANKKSARRTWKKKARRAFKVDLRNSN